jgi:hypothetical protein
VRVTVGEGLGVRVCVAVAEGGKGVAVGVRLVKFCSTGRYIQATSASTTTTVVARIPVSRRLPRWRGFEALEESGSGW